MRGVVRVIYRPEPVCKLSFGHNNSKLTGRFDDRLITTNETYGAIVAAPKNKATRKYFGSTTAEDAK